MEDTITVDLSIIWAGVIASAVPAYVAFDGFDLVFPFFRKRRDRDMMTNSIAPVCDDETSLALCGGLMAGFPLAYAIIMPAIT
ncbi:MULTISPECIES: cytochrome d ubiquinol oxidase subunit II [Neorhizobium]|jgi:cytochrome d ubiquinol oxidase subunit II|uniref:cytochrome d ubiquinol oxidase subunit II n=1 Tax=Neorhizobium sp. T6_25 TaxID=2093833 RepID=UPI000CF9BBD9|nr:MULTISPECIES: cytochrome d ubiquinol oxidase subunit II [Neorhizobium]